MVLAVIHPAGNGGKVIAFERLSVVAAHEILGGTATVGAAGIDVQKKHPLVFSLEGQADQVRALPHPVVVAVGQAEAAVILPVLKVVGAIELHLLAGGQYHLPLAGLVVPEHLGVPEVGRIFGHNHRIAGIFGEGAAVIQAVCYALGLVVTVGSIHGHNGVPAKAGSVVLIHHGAAAEDGAQIVRGQGYVQMLPVHEVLGDGVSPVHIAPETAVRVILIEQMPFPVLVDHSVGVVHPAPVRRKVVGGTVLFLLVGTVNGCGRGHIGPAHIVGRVPAHTAALGHLDIQQNAAAGPFPQVQRDQVVRLVNGQGNVGLEDHISVGEHLHLCFLGRFLHGQEDVAVGSANLDHTVRFTQMSNSKALSPGKDREHQSHKGKESFHASNIAKKRDF